MVFIIPNSIPLTADSNVTASLINPDGSSGHDLVWTYNGTAFTPDNVVQPTWGDDDYIDFHDSDVWHYDFAIKNGTVGERYNMCLHIAHLVEYERQQCQWQAVDQTGLIFAEFEDVNNNQH